MPLAIKAPVEVIPEVKVARPEIVGVAVQAVPVTVRLPPKVAVPVPTLKVFEPVTVVAPLRDTAPVPVPKVFAPVCENVLSRVVAP